VGLAGGLAAAVGGKVLGPVGEGLHAVAPRDGAEGRGRVRADVEGGDARVGEGGGVRAWEEFAGGEEVGGYAGLGGCWLV
jgi:hypothetical protein